MGWRDRDYAKFNDAERRRFFGSSGRRETALPPSAEGRGHSNALPKRVRKRRRTRTAVRPRFATGFAVAVLAVAGVAGYAATHPMNGSHPTVKPGLGLSLLPAAPSIRTVASPSNIIGIRWSRRDLARAANAGRICVTSEAHGRICASYVVGERPADNLTRRIESLGLHVQSSG